MLDTNSPLIAEFLKDHQQFSRLLFEISKLVEQDKFDQARGRAIELDRLAGPHIAYEESELYPRLAKLGDDTVSEEVLIDQHHDALAALRLLLTRETLTQEDKETIKNGFRGALSHAEHCGSLISFMSRLDKGLQAKSLKELTRLRVEGKKWTEL